MQFKPPFALRSKEDSRLFFEQNRWRIERILRLPLSPAQPRRLKQQPKQKNIMKFEQNFSLRSSADRKKFFEDNKWKIEAALQMPLSESTRPAALPIVEEEEMEGDDQLYSSPEAILADVVLDEDFNQPDVDFDNLEGEEDAIDIADIDAALEADEMEEAEDAAEDDFSVDFDDVEDSNEDFGIDLDEEKEGDFIEEEEDFGIETEEDGLDMGFEEDELEEAEEEAIEDFAEDISFDDEEALVVDNNNDGIEDILLDFDNDGNVDMNLDDLLDGI